MLNNYSRRQFFQLGGGLLLATSAAVSFPLIRTLAADTAKPILRFEFTLDGGGKGSFYLNTTTTPTVAQGTFGQEFSYFSAVSNFSFSGLDRNLKKQKAAWKVVPGVKAEFIGGFPSGTLGVLSGVNYPDGCSTGTANACSITVAVLYSGNLAELPKLSNEPSSYQIIGVDLINPDGQLNRINTTKSKVIALPESAVVD